MQSRAADDLRAVALPRRMGAIAARRSIMVGMNKHLAAALVLGLAVSVLATPSFAQRSDGGEAGMSSAREKALRDCNGEAGKMSQGTWGHQQLDNYRHLHGATRRAGITRSTANAAAASRSLSPRGRVSPTGRGSASS